MDPLVLLNDSVMSGAIARPQWSFSSMGAQHLLTWQATATVGGVTHVGFGLSKAEARRDAAEQVLGRGVEVTYSAVKALAIKLREAAALCVVWPDELHREALVRVLEGFRL